MDTLFIGIKEFRQNMAKVTQDALDNKRRIIILRKNEPIFELIPLSKKDRECWKFEIDYKDEGRTTSWMKPHKPSLH